MPKISFSWVFLICSKVLNRVPNRVSNRVPKQGSQTEFPSRVSKQGSQTGFPNIPNNRVLNSFNRVPKQGSQTGFPTGPPRNFPTGSPTHFSPTAQSLGSSAVSKCFGACGAAFRWIPPGSQQGSQSIPDFGSQVSSSQQGSE